MDYQWSAIGILRNKGSSKDRFSKQGQISRVICKPVSALSNKKTFESRALIKVVCEPCFVDYQWSAIGILRNKGSSEGSFRREGIIPCAIVHSCMCNKFRFVSFRFVSFRFVSRNTVSFKMAA